MVANQIVNKQREERDKTHGSLSDSMERAAKIASVLLDKPISTEDFFKCMLALKMSRLHASNNFDTLVDICGYTEGFNNFLKTR